MGGPAGQRSRPGDKGPVDSREPATQVLLGHWTDEDARTGCSVVVFPRSWPAVVEARGGAPGTRETDVLSPANMVRSADAILLTGGSAFGLAAADGVMSALRERGRGFQTSAGPVPIVPSAVLFDLTEGRPSWPGPAAGRAALLAAVPLDSAATGRVGAGTGATTGKVGGAPRPGGIGIGRQVAGDTRVTVVAAVNAFGVVGGPDPRAGLLAGVAPAPRVGENTTLVVVVIHGPVDAVTRQRVLIAAHDGMARTIFPTHTIFDGDTVFVASDGDGPVDTIGTLRLSVAAELATEAAIRDAVRVRPGERPRPVTVAG